MSEQVQTHVGTTVYETPDRVYDPENDEYVRLSNLSEDGYKRKLLAYKTARGSPAVIDLDNEDILSFDKEKWSLEETDGSFLLKKDADAGSSGSGGGSGAD